MTMTAEEQTLEGPRTMPMEGEDITPKKDGGVLKVNNSLHSDLVLWIQLVEWLAVCLLATLAVAVNSRLPYTANRDR